MVEGKHTHKHTAKLEQIKKNASTANISSTSNEEPNGDPSDEKWQMKRHQAREWQGKQTK